MRDKSAKHFGGIKYQSTVATVVRATFSPDGRWVAYTDAGGVYVQPFPTTGAKYQVALGHSPVWSRDGKRLSGLNTARKYDVGPDDTIFGVMEGSDTAKGISATPQINVVLNWFEELKERVPTK